MSNTGSHHPQPEAPPSTGEIWRRDVVLQKLGISQPTLWRWERAGHFPRAIKLGPQAVGYLATEVLAWIAARHADAHHPS
jgi:prophage regulatory protein